MLPTCITICVGLIRSSRLWASIASWGILALFFSPHLACLVPVPPSSPTVPCHGARLALGDFLLRPQKLAKQMASWRKEGRKNFWLSPHVLLLHGSIRNPFGNFQLYWAEDSFAKIWELNHQSWTGGSWVTLPRRVMFNLKKKREGCLNWCVIGDSSWQVRP